MSDRRRGRHRLMPEGQNTAVQSAGGRNWMIRIWNSAIVRNVEVIMSIVKSICLHIYMWNNSGIRQQFKEKRGFEYEKTKIVCTMGPGTSDPEIVRELIQNGMDIARFNFSHGNHEEQKERMDMIKRLREEEKVPVAILLDTKYRRYVPEC